MTGTFLILRQVGETFVTAEPAPSKRDGAIKRAGLMGDTFKLTTQSFTYKNIV